MRGKRVSELRKLARKVLPHLRRKNPTVTLRQAYRHVKHIYKEVKGE